MSQVLFYYSSISISFFTFSHRNPTPKNILGVHWDMAKQGEILEYLAVNTTENSTTYVTHHMFSRILNFLFLIVFPIQMTDIMAFYNLFWFLNENPFRTDQSKRQISWKNSGFVDLEFVKTCDELDKGCGIIAKGNVHFGPITFQPLLAILHRPTHQQQK